MCARRAVARLECIEQPRRKAPAMTGEPVSPAPAQRRGLPRPLLWLLLAIALAANGVTSVSSLPPVVGAGFGVLALGLAALLVRDHYRRRPRNGRRSTET